MRYNKYYNKKIKVVSIEIYWQLFYYADTPHTIQKYF